MAETRLALRRAVAARLDAAVSAHRVEVAAVVPLVGAAALVGGRLGFVPARVAFDPLLVLAGTLVLRLPLAAALAPLADRRAGAALAALAAYAYGVEYVGVRTGWPYGDFSYGVELGPMVGGVPVALPLFFVPLVCNAGLLAVRLCGERRRAAVRVPVAVALVLVVDLVLDPGAVALGFWRYGGGAYYGVPASNYAGWLLSATVGVLLFEAAFARAALADRLAACPYALDDLVSFVLLWGVVNAAFGNWLPVGLALALGAAVALAGTGD